MRYTTSRPSVNRTLFRSSGIRNVLISAWSIGLPWRDTAPARCGVPGEAPGPRSGLGLGLRLCLPLGLRFRLGFRLAPALELLGQVLGRFVVAVAVHPADTVAPGAGLVDLPAGLLDHPPRRRRHALRRHRERTAKPLLAHAPQHLERPAVVAHQASLHQAVGVDLTALGEVL